MMRTMRQLAPTRLALAGMGAGLLVYSLYSLYRAEMAIPFWDVWYVLAIVFTSAIGAAIAPRCLRW